MKKIAIITARGGSKRIPRKNIREFCGKPIIYYAIKAALESRVFDEVMVSTDDEEIAEISQRFGAEVPFMRGREASDDYASTVDVLVDVVKAYEKQGRFFEQICCIYPTACFITPNKIMEAMKLLENADCVNPVVKSAFSPLRALIVEQGVLVPKWEEYLKYRTQDLPDFYYDAGQFYCLWTEKMMKTKKIIMGKTVPLFMNELEAQDIDNETDWEIAELKYEYLRKHGKI